MSRPHVADPGSSIDLLCVGRLGIDLYGQQTGAGLATTETFRKTVGGSAANICVGTARLGLRTAMCSRVGAEAFGQFCLDTLVAEGVDVSAVQQDPDRPTGLVTLALKESDDFPRIFFYRDSADLAFDVGAFDPDLIARTSAVLLTGSFLSRPNLAAFSQSVASGVRARGGRVVIDLDYRPVLFGEVPVGRGNEMATFSPEVTAVYQAVLPLCDLIVGTEEEIRVATGADGIEDAISQLSGLSGATVVVKRGRLGAVAFPGAIESPGFGVMVQNTVGAGDGFMSGLLSRWLRGLPVAECMRAGNANGAIVASRHGCMPALAFAAELDAFLARDGIAHPDQDVEIERRHRISSRRPSPPNLFVLAVDHRRQLEEMADFCGTERDRLPRLKELFTEAFLRVAAVRRDVGILLDEQYGRAGLERVEGRGLFVFRAAEIAGTHPVELIGGADISAELRRWPAEQTVKVMTFTSDEDRAEIHELQQLRLLSLCLAARALGREVLVELQTRDGRDFKPGELAGLVQRFYGAGVQPEWWKIPPLADPAEWRSIGDIVRAEDPSCRGLLALGAEASGERIRAGFAAAASEPLGRGFAVGRSIFGAPAEEWLRQHQHSAADDEVLVEAVAARFRATIDAWESAAAQ